MKKTDGRKNARVKKGDVFIMEMMDAPYLEKFIEDLINSFGPGHRILNGCCGSSRLGDVRFDIDKNSNRTMDANLKDQLDIFRKNQFDFYIIDPLDAFYNPYGSFIVENYCKGKDKRGRKFGDPYRWQYDALEICKKALILQRPLQMTNWPKQMVRDVEYGLIRDSRPMGRILEIVWKK